MIQSIIESHQVVILNYPNSFCSGFCLQNDIKKIFDIIYKKYQTKIAMQSGNNQTSLNWTSLQKSASSVSSIDGSNTGNGARDKEANLVRNQNMGSVKKEQLFYQFDWATHVQIKVQNQISVKAKHLILSHATKMHAAIAYITFYDYAEVLVKQLNKQSFDLATIIKDCSQIDPIYSKLGNKTKVFVIQTDNFNKSIASHWIPNYIDLIINYASSMDLKSMTQYEPKIKKKVGYAQDYKYSGVVFNLCYVDLDASKLYNLLKASNLAAIPHTQKIHDFSTYFKIFRRQKEASKQISSTRMYQSMIDLETEKKEKKISWATHFIISPVTGEPKLELIKQIIQLNKNKCNAVLIHAKNQSNAYYINNKLANSTKSRIVQYSFDISRGLAELQNETIKVLILTNNISDQIGKFDIPAQVELIINTYIPEKPQLFLDRFRKQFVEGTRSYKRGVVVNFLKYDWYQNIMLMEKKYVDKIFEENKLQSYYLDTSVQSKDKYNFQKYFVVPQKVMNPITTTQLTHITINSPNSRSANNNMLMNQSPISQNTAANNDEKSGKGIEQDFKWATFVQDIVSDLNRVDKCIKYINSNKDRFHSCIIYTTAEHKGNRIVGGLTEDVKRYATVISLSSNKPGNKQYLQKIGTGELRVLVVCVSYNADMKNWILPASVDLVIFQTFPSTTDEYENMLQRQKLVNIQYEGVVMNFPYYLSQTTLLQGFSKKHNVVMDKNEKQVYQLRNLFRQTLLEVKPKAEQQKVQQQQEQKQKYKTNTQNPKQSIDQANNKQEGKQEGKQIQNKRGVESQHSSEDQRRESQLNMGKYNASQKNVGTVAQDDVKEKPQNEQQRDRKGQQTGNGGTVNETSKIVQQQQQVQCGNISAPNVQQQTQQKHQSMEQVHKEITDDYNKQIRNTLDINSPQNSQHSQQPKVQQTQIQNNGQLNISNTTQTYNQNQPPSPDLNQSQSLQNQNNRHDIYGQQSHDQSRERQKTIGAVNLQADTRNVRTQSRDNVDGKGIITSNYSDDNAKLLPKDIKDMENSKNYHQQNTKDRIKTSKNSKLLNQQNQTLGNKQSTNDNEGGRRENLLKAELANQTQPNKCDSQQQQKNRQQATKNIRQVGQQMKEDITQVNNIIQHQKQVIQSIRDNIVGQVKQTQTQNTNKLLQQSAQLKQYVQQIMSKQQQTIKQHISHIQSSIESPTTRILPESVKLTKQTEKQLADAIVANQNINAEKILTASTTSMAALDIIKAKQDELIVKCENIQNTVMSSKRDMMAGQQKIAGNISHEIITKIADHQKQAKDSIIDEERKIQLSLKDMKQGQQKIASDVENIPRSISNAAQNISAKIAGKTNIMMKEMSALQQQINAKRNKQMGQQNIKIEQFKVRIDKKQKMLTEFQLENELKQLKIKYTENVKQLQKIVSQKAQSVTINTELYETKRSLKEEKADKAKLLKKVAELTNENIAYKQNQAELSSRYITMQTQLSEQIQKLKESQQVTAQQRTQIESLSQQITEAKMELADVCQLRIEKSTNKSDKSSIIIPSIQKKGAVVSIAEKFLSSQVSTLRISQLIRKYLSNDKIAMEKLKPNLYNAAKSVTKNEENISQVKEIKQLMHSLDSVCINGEKENIFAYLKQVIQKIITESDSLKRYQTQFKRYINQLENTIRNLAEKSDITFKKGSECSVALILDLDKKESIANSPIKTICGVVNELNKMRKDKIAQLNKANKIIEDATKANQAYKGIIDNLNKTKKETETKLEESEQNAKQLKLTLQRVRAQLAKKITEFDTKQANYLKTITDLGQKLDKTNKDYQKALTNIENERKKGADAAIESQRQLDRVRKNAAQQALMKLRTENTEMKKKYDAEIEAAYKKYDKDIQEANKKYKDLKNKQKTNLQQLQLRLKNEKELQLQAMKNKHDQAINKINQQISVKQEKTKKFEDAVNKQFKQILGQEVQINSDNCERSLSTFDQQYKQKQGKVLFLPESEMYQRMDEPSKKFIYDNIIRVVPNKKIVATKTLFTAKSSEDWNRWRYKILDKQNILVMLTLENNQQVGGFSENPYSQTEKRSAGKGYLMSITNKKCYDVRRSCEGKVATYHQFSFIFGNNEFIIKDNMKFSVLIGYTYQNFQVGQDRGRDFVKMEDEEGYFREIEFHQIIFGKQYS